jgi:uncharacterized membrane protein YfcA
MSIDSGLLLLAFAGFAAYVIRGITGAASAVVFNSFLAVLLALGLLGDLTLLDGLYWISMADFLASVVLAVVIRRELRLEPFIRRFLLFSMPIGVVLAIALPRLDVAALAAGLGVALIGAGVYLTVRRDVVAWDTATLHRRALPAGLAAGLLSGLYGMAAPVVVVLLAHGGPDTSRFRARATVIALAFSSARVVTLIAVGAIGIDRMVDFAATAPVVLAGLAIGIWLHPKVGPRVFRATLGIAVLLAGGLLLIRTLVA